MTVKRRDMWAGRLSLTWDVSEKTEINFMYPVWEDDNRVLAELQVHLYGTRSRRCWLLARKGVTKARLCGMALRGA